MYCGKFLKKGNNFCNENCVNLYNKIDTPEKIKYCPRCQIIIPNRRFYCDKCLKRNKSPRNHSNEYLELIFSIFNNQCELCGSKKNLCIHHKIRLADGGANNIQNIMCLCKKCHLFIHHKFIKRLLEATK